MLIVLTYFFDRSVAKPVKVYTNTKIVVVVVVVVVVAVVVVI